VWIMIAGPYSAPTADQRKQNLDALNRAALQVLRKGHVPIVGVNAALPLVGEDCGGPSGYETMMRISLALAERCDSVLRLGRSPGADREVSFIEGQGKPVFESLSEIDEYDCRSK
jgi:hypothetical protein